MISGNLINSIEEQSVITFTGKINVLKKENGQFIGVIYLKEGLIVQAEFQSTKGKKALFNLIFEDSDFHESFKYVVEPEAIEDKMIAFEYTFELFIKKADSRYKNYLEVKPLKPPGHLKLSIVPKFISRDGDYSVGPEEFQVLCDIIDNAEVENLYKKSALYDYQITRSLVSLRKKGALVVSA